MKSIVVKDSYGLENVTIEEQPIPSIQENEILVKVQALSLNYLDLIIANGQFGKHKFPHVLGSDVAGIVEQVGSNVSNFKITDLVCSHYTQSWQEGPIKIDDMQSRLGTDVQGVFSEYIALPESSFVHIPQNLNVIEASTLPIAALTAWEALVNIGKLKPGQTVLIQGTGGVSIFALQFAKVLGAKVIITSSSDDKLKKAKLIGADIALNYKTNSNWRNDVLLGTSGNGVDLALEMTGSELNETLQYIKLNGKIAIIGFLSGSKVDLDVFNILHKNATIVGIKVGSRASFEAMNKAITLNNIKPMIDKVFPMSQLSKALSYFENGKHFGKVVLNF